MQGHSLTLFALYNLRKDFSRRFFMSGEGKLNVVGYGKLLVKPDYTKLFFKMNSKNENYKVALSELNEKVKDLTMWIHV